MRPAIKSDGSSYYEYILLYTDNILYINKNSRKVLKTKIGKYFKLKKIIDPPKIYLGDNISKIILENQKIVWFFSLSK